MVPELTLACVNWKAHWVRVSVPPWLSLDRQVPLENEASIYLYSALLSLAPKAVTIQRLKTTIPIKSESIIKDPQVQQ